MRITQPLLATGLLLSLITLNAEATLTSYTTNGVDYVRMQGANFDVSFTKDGNLLGTLESQYAASHGGSYSGLINTIISANDGVIHDTPNFYDNGTYNLSSSDFSINGSVSWWGAQAFVGYLNSINYGGSHQWSLPNVTDIGTPGCTFAFYATDCGYNGNPHTDPLMQLYYGELNKKASYNIDGVFPQSGFGIFGNNGGQIAGGAVGPFSNVQSSVYWSGTEYAPYPHNAWSFSTYYGDQAPISKGFMSYAWAVSPGLVAAVPVPGAIWLFGSGLVGLLGLKRRGHAG